MSGFVVVGDSLLDRDLDGQVRRLAPDALAPVLDEESSVDRPGGAALAALLAAEYGYRVTLITALAGDPAATRVAELLAAAGVIVHALTAPAPTPEKIRLRCSGQVLLRLDRGGNGPGRPAPLDPGDPALELIRDAEAVVASDYGRGLLRDDRLRAALAGAPAPVVWDPHMCGPDPVWGARLVTPNEAELRALGKLGAGGPRLSTATRGAAWLRKRWGVGAVAVTLGGDGALLCHAGPIPLVVPAPVRVTGDSCGAGDRFAVAAAVALARGADVSEAVRYAVAEASAYVSRGGVSAMSGASSEVASLVAVPTAAPVASAGQDRVTGPTSQLVAAAGTARNTAAPARNTAQEESDRCHRMFW